MSVKIFTRFFRAHNVVRMRTFSKAYGLAGIRCGYAFGDAEVIADFEKVRNHYGVSRMAQIAGEEALADQDYLAHVVALVAAGRERIATVARDNGLKPLPSATNFVTIDCGADAAFALAVMRNLLARDEDIGDLHIPLLLWWAIESKAESGVTLTVWVREKK